MERILIEGLDAGYLGLSVQTLPWDKLDGDRHRSKPTPYYARWSEYRRLNRILRARGRIFRVPNVKRSEHFSISSRKPVSVVHHSEPRSGSLMDLIANRSLYRLYHSYRDSQIDG